VRKTEFARRDFFDAWLPELAPTSKVVTWALSEPWTPARWRRYARRYHREMNEPRARHLIATLAALSHTSNFSVGCYCADPSHCHRSLLRDLLVDAGATVVPDTNE
jgi:uncharacterized protein YeaO (DUF488 family)